MAGVDRSMDPMEWAKFVIRNRDERNYVEAYSIFIRESKTDNPEAEPNRPTASRSTAPYAA